MLSRTHPDGAGSIAQLLFVHLPWVQSLYNRQIELRVLFEFSCCRYEYFFGTFHLLFECTLTMLSVHSHSLEPNTRMVWTVASSLSVLMASFHPRIFSCSPVVLSYFPIAAITSMTKATWPGGVGRRGWGPGHVYLACTLRSQSITEGSQDKNSSWSWSGNSRGMLISCFLPQSFL